MPNMLNAGDYSGVSHYLKSVAAAGTTEPSKVAEKMRELPIEDQTLHHGTIRSDGRVIRDMYLFQVKSPSQSHYPWDYYTLVATVPGDQAFRPLAEGGCSLAAK
jgi:branched-chain amino acid transport system substrate-binding protein